MTRLHYIANIRLPTEKAHGLQIMQNCEAFANAGCKVTLWIPRRTNTAAMRRIQDIYDHYGVASNFKIRRLPTIDLLDWLGRQPGSFVARMAFYLQLFSFSLALALRMLFTRGEVFYSRDPFIIWLLSFIKPRHTIIFEAHQFSPTASGKTLQRRVVRRAGAIIAITPPLARDFIEFGADEERVMVAHDGFRVERFANLPPRDEARRILGWPQDAFIVGYMGRLKTLDMTKGVDILLAAAAQMDEVTLALVGGPEETAIELREEWLQYGQAAERFLFVDHVPPDQVPLYLRAFDVCAMPLPWMEHFAYYASPLKLFEYMAAGGAIVASNFPAWEDVLQDGVNALLTPPSDIEAIRAALQRLRDDPALREQLGMTAQQRAFMHYTWEARARAILKHIRKLEE